MLFNEQEIQKNSNSDMQPKEKNQILQDLSKNTPKFQSKYFLVFLRVYLFFSSKCRSSIIYIFFNEYYIVYEGIGLGKQEISNENLNTLSNIMSPIKALGNISKQAQQQNVTPFTKFINQLSPISKISKDASLDIQNFKQLNECVLQLNKRNIQPNLIKKQKLNYYQTPSPKVNKNENQKVDIQPFLKLTAQKVMQNLQINESKTGNKNITYIKIKSPIINLNYSKIADLEDELNIYKYLENSNLENIIPQELNDTAFPAQQRQQNETNQHINPDISNFIYEFKMLPNNNQGEVKRECTNSSHCKQQSSVDEEDENANDQQEDEFFEDFSLYDSALQPENQQQLEDHQGQIDVQTAQKLNENNKTIASEQQKLENKILKFEQFETPKQTRGRKPSKGKFWEQPSNNHHHNTLSELNLLKTKQQLKQMDKQQLLQQNWQLQINKQLNDSQQNGQSGEKKKIGCNCKKSRCLKLYCDCFANGQFCISECNCCDCANKQDNEDERYSVMLQLIERYFSQKQVNNQQLEILVHLNRKLIKPIIIPRYLCTCIIIIIQEEQHVRGCNCAKSGCVKKYCECFQANVKCTALCKCESCKNKDESINEMEIENSIEHNCNKITFSKKTPYLNNIESDKLFSPQPTLTKGYTLIKSSNNQIHSSPKIQEDIKSENNSKQQFEQVKTQKQEHFITKSKRIVKKSSYLLSPQAVSPQLKLTAKKFRKRGQN